jgi:hypothetical protein
VMRALVGRRREPVAEQLRELGDDVRDVGATGNG